eukprot:CAMPEP_0184496488 /NCGR_PEP_ID=MMETSP0113_2-20130426/34079_1 /TAXON_ID=91329 /ORGANISM="Norrisiella sphaerica, Strain BC52" /LENGTH=368 /DNA_ID=CAMNT_0026883129 /DNA_START=48 /DNA_END=1151 /DNA_ORIENTATION=+
MELKSCDNLQRHDTVPPRVKLIHGTCGWSDPGSLWYKRGNRATKCLRNYSRDYGFGCVEIDTTCYALKPPDAVAKWAASTPRGFELHEKIFGFFPARGGHLLSLPRDFRGQIPENSASNHAKGGLSDGNPMPLSAPRRSTSKSEYVRLQNLPPAVVAELWRRFNAMLEPLVTSGKMGAVLVQFHTNFRPSQSAEDHVRWVRARLRKDVRMAVEFRNRLWLGSSMDEKCLDSSRLRLTCSLMQEIDAVLVASDDLKQEAMQKNRDGNGFRNGAKRVRLAPIFHSGAESKSTHPENFAFCRIRRRHDTNRLLLPEELEDWVAKLELNYISEQHKLHGAIHMPWGTDHLDHHIRSGKASDSLLPEKFRFTW